MSFSAVESGQAPAIHPIEFWTDYQPGPDGSMIGHEWVRWVKKGDRSGATTDEKVARVQKASNGIWDVIRPHYDAWKKGQEIPEHGTPLDAAPFMTREMAKVLRGVHIVTIEDMATAADSDLARLGIPGIRGVQQKARAFLDAQANLAGVSNEIAELREMVTQLKAERDEAAAARDMLASESGRRRRSREEVMPMQDAG